MNGGPQLYTRSLVEFTGQARRWDGERDSWPEALADQGLVRLTTGPYPVAPTDACGHFNQCVFYKARGRRAERWDVIVTQP